LGDGKHGDEQEQHDVVALTTPSEATLDTFAALSNMVPLLGGAIGTVLSGLSNDRKLQRVNEVLWAMSKDIRDLSEESEKYVTTDEFKDLLDETLHKVYEERSEEKRRLYKEFLVDEIREPWRSPEDQHRFLRTLEAVTAGTHRGAPCPPGARRCRSGWTRHGPGHRWTSPSGET